MRAIIAVWGVEGYAVCLERCWWGDIGLYPPPYKWNSSQLGKILTLSREERMKKNTRNESEKVKFVIAWRISALRAALRISPNYAICGLTEFEIHNGWRTGMMSDETT